MRNLNVDNYRYRYRYNICNCIRGNKNEPHGPYENIPSINMSMLWARSINTLATKIETPQVAEGIEHDTSDIGPGCQYHLHTLRYGSHIFDVIIKAKVV